MHILNWNEGYHPDGCVPSTDNALESTNRQLKEKGTFRQRLPCGQFVNIVENKLLKDFSTSRNPFCIKNGIQVPTLDYENHCYNDEPKIEFGRTHTHGIMIGIIKFYFIKAHIII